MVVVSFTIDVAAVKINVMLYFLTKIKKLNSKLKK